MVFLVRSLHFFLTAWNPDQIGSSEKIHSIWFALTYFQFQTPGSNYTLHLCTPYKWQVIFRATERKVSQSEVH